MEQYQKYACFNDDGFPVAFYSEEIHGDSIPENALPVAFDAWQGSLENPRCWRLVNGDFVQVEPVAMLLTWDDVRNMRQAKFNDVSWRIDRAADNGEDLTPYRAYRQGLRDITEQPDPNRIKWPVPPWL